MSISPPVPPATRRPSPHTAETSDSLRPVYQPVVELGSGAVVGYEALARGEAGARLTGAAELFAAARASDRLVELDGACLRAAIRDAAAVALAAPMTLFLNAEPATFEQPLPEADPALRCVVEFTERALTRSPASVLRALERIRAAGWGVALDALGAEPRALALISLLQPDVIKLDVARIRAGGPEHVAAVAAVAGVERERSGSTLLAKGIETASDLVTAEACGATLGQGFRFGAPEALPQPLPAPGGPVRLVAAGADPWGSTPWRRVTNLNRPRTASQETVRAIVEQVERQAAALGVASGLLEVPAPRSGSSTDAARDPAGRREAIEARVGMLRVLQPGPADGDLADTWTVVAFGPFFAAVFVARPGEGTEWRYALTYERRTAIECALMLAARLDPVL